MTSILLVFLGGGLGSVLRWGVGQGLQTVWKHPYAVMGGTLIANLLACWVLGWALAKGSNPKAMLLVTVGICGGFSTFSTFSYEVLGLLRQGEWGIAGGYVLCSVLLGLAAVALGLRWG